LIEAQAPRVRAWAALLPLLIVPCCWLWWWAGGLNPGLEVGRAATVVLIAAAATACWARSLPAAALPLLLALAWQAAALLWAPVREPGGQWLAERAAACAAAIGLVRWQHGPGALPGLALAGLGILGLTALCQGPAGLALRIGHEAPFGNVNFAVGAALPLAAVGVASLLLGDRRWLIYTLMLAAVAVLLGRGWGGGDPCNAVWLGLVATVAAALVLRLPARVHLPALAGLAVVFLLVQSAATAGFGDPGQLGAGSAYRVHLWRSALEALTGPAALVGYGPGAALAVLPEQAGYAAAWLTVPSYAAHAHHEGLQVLLDGGLVLAALLGWGLWATLAPLWRERADPAAAALLVGWIAAGTLACVESHLAQPGGLLCLAVLAAATWARSGGSPLSAALRAGPAAVAAILAGLAVRELAGDGGGAVSIETRARAALVDEPAARLTQLDRLRARLGPLEDLDLLRARALGRLGRHDEAAAALAAHLRRLPVDAAGLLLAGRMRTAGKATPELAAALATARQRATVLLSAVPENPVNRDARTALAEVLAADGPDRVR